MPFNAKTIDSMQNILSSGKTAKQRSVLVIRKFVKYFLIFNK